MAISHDTLYPENGQSDLSTLLSVLNLYRADIANHYLDQAKDHFSELHQSILCGMGAMGNLMYWASTCEDYEAEKLRNDLQDIGYLFSQLKEIAYFALSESERWANKRKSESGSRLG